MPRAARLRCEHCGNQWVAIYRDRETPTRALCPRCDVDSRVVPYWIPRGVGNFVTPETRDVWAVRVLEISCRQCGHATIATTPPSAALSSLACPGCGCGAMELDREFAPGDIMGVMERLNELRRHAWFDVVASDALPPSAPGGGEGDDDAPFTSDDFRAALQ